MSSLVSFRKAQHGRCRSAPDAPKTSDFDIEAAAFIAAAHARTQEIHHSIQKLDLAAQHARLIVKQIADPVGRRRFGVQLEMIERSLQLARAMASKL